MPESVETVEIHDPNKPGEYLIVNRVDLKPGDRVRGAEPPAARPAVLPKVTTPDEPDAEPRKRGPGRPRKTEE